MSQGIKIGSSNAQESSVAIREIYQQIKQQQTSLVILFISVEYDLEQLSLAINKQFVGITVIGCTTSGEIGPAGYISNGITAVSFASNKFSTTTHRFSHLQELSISNWQKSSSETYLRHIESRPSNSDTNTFAFLLVDGLSVREEPLVRAIHNAIPQIPLVGGSAGDNLHFQQTFVFHAGSFHSDSAILVLVDTSQPFKVFNTQHFLRSDKRMVVTDADPARRIVTEINALPAAMEYARMVDLEIEELTPMIFAAHPVVVKIGDSEYVRSIQKVNADGSLTFYCAIDIGIVLTVAKGINIVDNLQQSLMEIEKAIGSPQVIITCDCILRSLELDQTDLKKQVGEMLVQYNSVGFSTYGEQFNGVHVNQTLTAIAIGEKFD